MLTQPLARKTLYWLITVSAVVLLTSPTVRAQPATPQQVYRIEMLPPEIVFEEGLISDGSVFSVLDHVNGRTCTDDLPSRRTAWISTTSDRAQAEHFFFRQMQREHANQSSATPTQAWLYLIHTDHSYLQVESVIAQAITAARNNLHGYIPSNATVLERMQEVTNIRDRAEVLTTRIAPRRIISAQRVTYDPRPGATQRLVLGETQTNANFRPPQSPIDNLVDNLNTLVPVNSPELVGFGDRVTMSCFQTCDGASASHRQKRSLTPLAHGYCTIEPSKAEIFTSSDD